MCVFLTWSEFVQRKINFFFFFFIMSIFSFFIYLHKESKIYLYSTSYKVESWMKLFSKCSTFARQIILKKRSLQLNSLSSILLSFFNFFSLIQCRSHNGSTFHIYIQNCTITAPNSEIHLHKMFKTCNMNKGIRNTTYTITKANFRSTWTTSLGIDPSSNEGSTLATLGTKIIPLLLCILHSTIAKHKSLVCDFTQPAIIHHYVVNNILASLNYMTPLSRTFTRLT